MDGNQSSCTFECVLLTAGWGVILKKVHPHISILEILLTWHRPSPGEGSRTRCCLQSA